MPIVNNGQDIISAIYLTAVTPPSGAVNYGKRFIFAVTPTGGMPAGNVNDILEYSAAGWRVILHFITCPSVLNINGVQYFRGVSTWNQVATTQEVTDAIDALQASIAQGVVKVVNTIADRDAIIAGDRVEGLEVFVINATGDTTVNAGGAMYILKAGLTNADWVKTYEAESLDLILSAANTSYDNTTSGASSTNVQDATDEAFARLVTVENRPVGNSGEGKRYFLSTPATAGIYAATETFTESPTTITKTFTNVYQTIVEAETDALNITAIPSGGWNTDISFTHTHNKDFTAKVSFYNGATLLAVIEGVVLPNNEKIVLSKTFPTFAFTSGNKLKFKLEAKSNHNGDISVYTNDGTKDLHIHTPVLIDVVNSVVQTALDSKQNKIVQVASQAAMLALTGKSVGDIVSRTDDNNYLYNLTALPASSLSNWEVIGKDAPAPGETVEDIIIANEVITSKADGLYAFTGTPNGGFPAGVTQGDIAQKAASVWTVVYTFLNAPAAIFANSDGKTYLKSINGAGINTWQAKSEPSVYEVGPDKQYTTLQSAVDAYQSDFTAARLSVGVIFIYQTVLNENVIIGGTTDIQNLHIEGYGCPARSNTQITKITIGAFAHRVTLKNIMPSNSTANAPLVIQSTGTCTENGVINTPRGKHVFDGLVLSTTHATSLDITACDNFLNFNNCDFGGKIVSVANKTGIATSVSINGCANATLNIGNNRIVTKNNSASVYRGTISATGTVILDVDTATPIAYSILRTYSALGAPVPITLGSMIIHDDVGGALQMLKCTTAYTIAGNLGVGTAIDLTKYQVQTDSAKANQSTTYTKTETDAAISATIAALDVMVFKGVINASTNPNYPAGDAGHTYRISVAGKIGGASGANVEAGDMLLCLVDATVSGNQATVGANWNISQANIDGAVISNETVTVDNDFIVFSGTTGKIIKKVTLASYKTLLALVKGDVGLGNVDNTTDLNKPISTATQTALDLKQNIARRTKAFTNQATNFTISQADIDNFEAFEFNQTTAGIIATLSAPTGSIKKDIYFKNLSTSTQEINLVDTNSPIAVGKMSIACFNGTDYNIVAGGGGGGGGGGGLTVTADTATTTLDLNTLTTTALVQYTNATLTLTNAPSNVGTIVGGVFVETYATANRIDQTLTANNTKWSRQYVSSAWSAWAQTQNVENLSSQEILDIYDTPPASPANGDVQIVGGTPTGAFVGNVGKLATYNSGSSSWSFATPAANQIITLSLGTNAATINAYYYAGQSYIYNSTWASPVIAGFFWQQYTPSTIFQATSTASQTLATGYTATVIPSAVTNAVTITPSLGAYSQGYTHTVTNNSAYPSVFAGFPVNAYETLAFTTDTTAIWYPQSKNIKRVKQTAHGFATGRVYFVIPSGVAATPYALLDASNATLIENAGALIALDANNYVVAQNVTLPLLSYTCLINGALQTFQAALTALGGGSSTIAAFADPSNPGGILSTYPVTGNAGQVATIQTDGVALKQMPFVSVISAIASTSNFTSAFFSVNSCPTTTDAQGNIIPNILRRQNANTLALTFSDGTASQTLARTQSSSQLSIVTNTTINTAALATGTYVVIADYTNGSLQYVTTLLANVTEVSAIPTLTAAGQYSVLINPLKGYKFTTSQVGVEFFKIGQFAVVSGAITAASVRTYALSGMYSDYNGFNHLKNNSLKTFLHYIGSTNVYTAIDLRCISADNGFVDGDIIKGYTNSNGSYGLNQNIFITDLNTVKVLDPTQGIIILTTTGTAVYITANKWKFIAYMIKRNY